MTTLEKLEDLIYHGFKETDQKFKETDQKFQETERLFQELRTEVSGLTRSVGLFAEHSVKPAVVRLFAERGIELTDLYSRVSHRRDGGTMEVDVLAVGPQHVIAVEVKLRLELQDVKDFLEELPHFFDFFERFRGLTLYGAVAGMSIDEGVDRHAYKQGLFVLTQSGENICLLNDKKFVPRSYRYPA